MPDDNSVLGSVADTVTAPVEPVETEAHEILSEAVDAADETASALASVASQTRTEAEIAAARAEGESLGALDSATMLSTVRDAMDAHIAEHHAAPVVGEPSEESHEAAVTIDVPPLDEIAPDVAESGGDGGSVTVSRRRRVFKRSR